MKVRNLETEAAMLADTINNTDGNGDTNYGGAGNGEGRAREYGVWDEEGDYMYMSPHGVWDE